MNRIHHHAAIYLLTALLFACGSDPRAALRSRMAGDLARFEQDHVLLQQRADALKERYDVWEKEATGGDATRYVPGLERTSIRVGDLQAIVESDARFIADVGEAAGTIPEDQAGQAAFAQHYDELLEGHRRMVQEFGAIADKVEQQMAR